MAFVMQRRSSSYHFAGIVSMRQNSRPAKQPKEAALPATHESALAHRALADLKRSAIELDVKQ